MDAEDMKNPHWRTIEVQDAEEIDPIWLFEHAVEWRYSADSGTKITLDYLSTKPMPRKVKAEDKP